MKLKQDARIQLFSNLQALGLAAGSVERAALLAAVPSAPLGFGAIWQGGFGLSLLLYFSLSEMEAGCAHPTFFQFAGSGAGCRLSD